MGIHPVSLDAVVVFVDGNGHVLAGIDHLQASIFHIRLVHRKENSEVLDVLDMRVGHSIDMRSKATFVDEKLATHSLQWLSRLSYHYLRVCS